MFECQGATRGYSHKAVSSSMSTVVSTPLPSPILESASLRSFKEHFLATGSSGSSVAFLGTRQGGVVLTLVPQRILDPPILLTLRRPSGCFCPCRKP